MCCKAHCEQVLVMNISMLETRTNLTRRGLLRYGLSAGLLLPKVVMATQVPKPKPANRIAGYPALDAYVKSLRSIPAGTFQMGSTSGDPNEIPVHSVTVSSFRMGATPVTFAVWKEYCAATNTKLPESPPWGLLNDHPVVNVSWNDIMGVDGKGGFCKWASDIAGIRLTLPTEAQFDYAARGRQSGLEYPWGNKFDTSKIWSSVSTKRSGTAPVIRTSYIFRNVFGLTDMSGNVNQWCSDIFGPYKRGAQKDPIGNNTSRSKERCFRCGSWDFSSPDNFRSSNRAGLVPFYKGETVGFRLSSGPG